MFCPKCGQQSSDEVRFCPRCGLQLDGLVAYVAANGHTPVGATVPRAPVMTARRRGMRRGAKLMFICAVLLPAAALLAFEGDAPGPLLLVLTGGLAGLALAGLLLAVQRQRPARRKRRGPQRPRRGGRQAGPRRVAVHPRAALQPAAREHRRDIPAAQRHRQHDEACSTRTPEPPSHSSADGFEPPVQGDDLAARRERLLKRT